MSDVFGKQPVQTLNAGDVQVKIADATTPSQQAKVDSSGNLQVIINNTGSNPVPIQGGNSTSVKTADTSDGPVTPGTVATTSILTGGQYNSSLPTLASAQQAAVQLDSSGRVLVSQTTATALNATVVQPTAANFNATVVQATASNLNSTAAQGAPNTSANGWPVKITDGTNVVGVSPASTAAVATQPAQVVGFSPNSPLPLGTNLIGGATVYVGSSAASNSNPVPVTITNTPSGTVVNKYNSTAALASAGVANHVYTITSSKTFSGKLFWASSTAAIRADIQTSPDGSTYTTFWTSFNSPSNPNISIALDTLEIQDSGAGSTIRIQITNDDVLAANVYSTISGQEN